MFDTIPAGKSTVVHWLKREKSAQVVFKMGAGILRTLLLDKVSVRPEPVFGPEKVDIRRRYCVFGGQHSELSRQN